MAWLVFYKVPWIADPCALESNFFSYILFIQTLSSNQASIWLSLSGLRPWSYLWLPISAVFYILPSSQHIHLYFFQNPCRIHPSHTPRSPPCDIDTCLSEPLLFSSALCPSQELHSVSALYFLPSVQQWFSKTEPGNTSTPQLLYGQMPFQRPPWSHWNRGLTIPVILILHSSSPFGLWSHKPRILLLGPHCSLHLLTRLVPSQASLSLTLFRSVPWLCSTWLFKVLFIIYILF